MAKKTKPAEPKQDESQQPAEAPAGDKPEAAAPAPAGRKRVPYAEALASVPEGVDPCRYLAEQGVTPVRKYRVSASGTGAPEAVEVYEAVDESEAVNFYRKKHQPKEAHKLAFHAECL
jgi:hypothetical protein